jgi:hypothetical protein
VERLRDLHLPVLQDNSLSVSIAVGRKKLLFGQLLSRIEDHVEHLSGEFSIFFRLAQFFNVELFIKHELDIALINEKVCHKFYSSLAVERKPA